MPTQSNLLDDRTSLRSAVGERRTIVFTDIVGSTRLVNRLGDSRWLDVIRAHHGQARELGIEFGAEHLSGTGDGVFAVFVEASRALRFASEMRERVRRAAARGHCDRVQLHVGVASGPVLAWQGDYFGRIVHLASRLSTAGGPGEIIVSCTTAEDLCDPHLYVGSPYELELRGFERAESVHRLRPEAFARAAALAGAAG
jgi:class 3 adenylate cyclase